MDETIVLNQRIVIARLRDYCDYTPALAHFYHNDQASFMQEQLGSMAEPIMKLKKAIFSNVCAGFMEALKKTQTAEPLHREDLLNMFDKFTEFYEHMFYVLDNFAYSSDFREIKDLLPYPRAERMGDTIMLHREEEKSGSDNMRELRNRLSGLKLVSLMEEERKRKQERDPDIERLISYTYKRFGLDAREKEFTERVKEWSKTCPERVGENETTLDRVLSRFWDDVLPHLRKEVSDYCCQFRIPTNTSEDGTLTPFMLPRVEILIPVHERFFNRIRSLYHHLTPA